MKTVAVVDYGAGNLLSVVRALSHVGADPVLVNDAASIEAAPLLVLPGVGAFGAAMRELAARNLIGALRAYVGSGRPFLGICLGKQMMMEESEEFGRHEGLGLIAGRVVPVPAITAEGRPHRIPHIGWADLKEPEPGRWKGTLLDGTPVGTSAYFVHSFHAVPTDPAHVLAWVEYDGVPITAAIRRGHLFGCQFHPEKSGEAGLAMLRRFVELG